MGLSPQYLEFILTAIYQTFGDIHGKEILELGNQHLKRTSLFQRKMTGKQYFTDLGAHHTSIDLNGKDGSIKLDLSTALDIPDWRRYFDIITNSGTTEHVEPYEAQFECFANIHNWLKPGGIVVHIVPGYEELKAGGRWKNHCNNYYSNDFFRCLSEKNGYQLVRSDVINDLKCVCLQKISDNPFMTDRSEFLRGIIRTSGGVIYLGINDGNLRLFQKVFLRFRDVGRILTKKFR